MSVIITIFCDGYPNDQVNNKVIYKPIKNIPFFSQLLVVYAQYSMNFAQITIDSCNKIVEFVALISVTSEIVQTTQTSLIDYYIQNQNGVTGNR